MFPKKKASPASEINGLNADETQEMADTLSSIAELAYSDKKPSNLPTALSTRAGRSRFFFIPTESIDEEIIRRKKQFEKPKMRHVDEEVQQRLKKYKKQAPKKFRTYIDEVREFFLLEIAPRTIAMDAGIEQARSVVGGLLKSDIDVSVFNRFERMMNAAVDLTMAEFIADLFKLTPEDARKMLEEINFKPKHVSLFSGAPSPVAQGRRPASTTPVMTKPLRNSQHEEEF